MASPPDISGCILAGGLSRRMGRDKPLLNVDGETLISRVIARLRPQVARVAINANGDPARFDALACPVLADPFPGHPGPLAGILAAMDDAGSAGYERVATVAADTPFFPCNFVERLAAGDSAVISVAASGERVHPVFALWPVLLAPALRDHLKDEGDRSVMRFVRAQRHRIVAFPPSSDGGDAFFNVNTPEDLAVARRRAQSREKSFDGEV
ncbi:molybdenum cofactor guanylyltransferase MobA [Pararhizobium mangrovi]|uniref:Molybdenum cofactor guanylyltransferase n=1 Tax=Pararhizobium mangrovi TaxID=2590452 RepID=A0A506UI43_9HYPH|nr:molybdenum cofactor guanylyltransferase MobA [Pararhizobium mangrovi]